MLLRYFISDVDTIFGKIFLKLATAAVMQSCLHSGLAGLRSGGSSLVYVGTGKTTHRLNSVLILEIIDIASFSFFSTELCC